MANTFPKVVGAMSDEEVAYRVAQLDLVSEEVIVLEQADALTAKGLVDKGVIDNLIELWNGKPPLWKSNAHAFGFIPPSEAGATTIDIVEVGDLEADETLQNQRVNITLNVLRVAEYPGGGTHRILFDFYARNQTRKGSEEVHYNALYRVREGERAGVKGSPVFIGLGIGTEGLSIRCYTVNVKNDDDEELLSILDSPIFKNGLHLASALQPAITPLSAIAVGLTKTVASRNRNIPVQDVTMGLDFKNIPGGARLAEGAYVIIQIPETNRQIWNWTEWTFQKSSGQIVRRTSPKELIPYNYFVLGISKYSGD